MSKTAPPQPDGLPLLGNGVAFVNDPVGAMESWATHGDIVQLTFMGDTRYLVAHPRYIQQILVEKHHKFTISDDQQAAFEGVEDHAMTMATGEEWSQLRKASHPAFTRDRIAAYGDRMAAITARFVDEWSEGDTFELHPEMRRLTVQILGETLLDTDLRGDESLVIEAADALVAKSNFQRPGQLLPDWIPTPTDRRFRRTVSRLDEYVEELISERQASRRENATDVCSILLDAHEDGTLTLEQVRDNLVSFLLAGHESPSGVLTRSWYLLGKHPAVLERVEAEYESVVDGSYPTTDEFEQLAFTQQVIAETLRLYPPTTAVARKAIEPVTLGEYDFPAGSAFMMPQWLAHRDERFWEDPTTFDPDRWDEAAPDRPEYAYFPFSGGPRGCIGNDFARQELTLSLATMVGRVDLEIDAPEQLEFIPSIQLRPKTSITATVGDRGSS